MKALVMMECSGRVRDAFIACGHDAISCDILPTEQPGPHSTLHWYEFLERYPDGWDLMIAHPPCTFLTLSGNRWLSHPDDKHLAAEKRRPHPNFPTRAADRIEGIRVVEALWNQKQIPRIALENPRGVLPRLSSLGKPTQVVHPWWFGDPEKKATCLWLKQLPLLEPTNIVEPLLASTWKEPPGPDRQRNRSRTFLGFAMAMAVQWGGFIV
jgi:hypothetical protein